MPADNQNDELIDTKKFVRKIQKWTLISGLIFGILLALIWSYDAGYGFLSGLAVGIINFQLMSVDSYRIVDKNPRNAKKFIIGRYILRSGIMFGFIALVVTRTDFNIAAAFLGLFHVKIILVGAQMLRTVNFTGKTS